MDCFSNDTNLLQVRHFLLSVEVIKSLYVLGESVSRKMTYILYLHARCMSYGEWIVCV